MCAACVRVYNGASAMLQRLLGGHADTTQHGNV
jgi:hypothetical protein